MTDAVEKPAPLRAAARRDDTVPAVPTQRHAPAPADDRPNPPSPHQHKSTILDVLA